MIGLALFFMCKAVNYFFKSKWNVTNASPQAIQKQSTFEQIHAFKVGGRFTFLYSVSSSALRSCSRGDTGGCEGNGLMGLGRARILPSSPNHRLP